MNCFGIEFKLSLVMCGVIFINFTFLQHLQDAKKVQKASLVAGVERGHFFLLLLFNF